MLTNYHTHTTRCGHAEGTEGPERAAYLQQVISAVDTLGNRGVIHPPTQIQATLAGQVRKAIER